MEERQGESDHFFKTVQKTFYGAQESDLNIEHMLILNDPRGSFYFCFTIHVTNSL